MARGSAKMPYEDTSVPWGRSQAQITGLLYENGATAHQWTESREHDMIVLRFTYKANFEGVEREVGVQVRWSLSIQYSERSKLSLDAQKERRRNQLYRGVWWYLKSMFEAIRFGFFTFEDVFLSRILVKLPGGGDATVLQMAMPALKEAASTELLPEDQILKRSALKG